RQRARINDCRLAFLRSAVALLRLIYAPDRGYWLDSDPVLLAGDCARRPLFCVGWPPTLSPRGTRNVCRDRHCHTHCFAAGLPEGLTATHGMPAPADRGPLADRGRPVNHWRLRETSCYLARQHRDRFMACAFRFEVNANIGGRLRHE